MTESTFPNDGGLRGEMDVVCFSHLRWDFVYQRPQHLMSRFARSRRVFFVEEPVAGDGDSRIEVSERGKGVFVCVPNLRSGNGAFAAETMAVLIDEMKRERRIENYITWFYTPMMLDWSSRLEPRVVVYDCMDELSGFKNAPADLCIREKKLFSMADLVFTGGQSLYEAKREQHRAVYAFPSSIDAAHFSKALTVTGEFPAQAEIPHPRIGFAGVIDERLDISLLEAVADLRPDFQFVMVGPVVKIDENDLPRRKNIHYLGRQDYADLPAIMAGWDVAIMPFAQNESTRFISPTKTPEYLAAGLPVVSTAIADVVRPYGDLGLVHIASTPDEFVDAIQSALDEDGEVRRTRAAEFIGDLSWDKTFVAMSELIDAVASGANENRLAADAA